MKEMSQSDQLEGEIIGLDVGKKRIGVARVNTLARIPETLDPILTDGVDSFFAVLTYLKDHDAVGVVVGLPRSLDGLETAQTKEIREFVSDLKQKTTTPVYLIDEAGTSVEAVSRLNGKPGSVDSEAAAIILEDFVNFKNKQDLKV